MTDYAVSHGFVQRVLSFLMSCCGLNLANVSFDPLQFIHDCMLLSFDTSGFQMAYFPLVYHQKEKTVLQKSKESIAYPMVTSIFAFPIGSSFSR